MVKPHKPKLLYASALAVLIAGWATQTRPAHAVSPPPPPTVATGLATNVTRTSATLSGTVNPNGSATTYIFVYGTSSDYYSRRFTSPTSAGSGTATLSESVSISGLTPGTTYHFGISANNPSGTNRGADKTFTTLPRPLKLTVSPNHTRARSETCFSFKATSSGHAVAGVTIHLAGRAAKTSHTGMATICGALERGTYHPSATKPTYRTARAAITAATTPTRGPTFTG